MTSRNTLNLVLYGRVSADRREGKSVDEQLAWLRAWADREGHRVVSEHRDDGIGASRYSRRTDRPGWQDVMADIDSGAANSVAVWEASRASRDKRVWRSIIDALQEAGGYFVEGGRVADPSDPDDEFRMEFDALLSARESAMTRKRVLRAVHARAQEGRPHGQPVYGTRIVYDQATGKPARREIDPGPAAIVREIARRLLAGGGGNSAMAIAADLNAREVPSPREGRWTGANLVRLVQRPSLAGLRTYQGQTLEGVSTTSPTVLDVDTHRRLVALLTDPARTTTRDGSHRRSLLVGVARCGVCDGPMRVVTKPLASGARSTVYRCREHFCVSRTAADVDALVEAVIVELLSRPELAAALRAADPSTSVAADEAARLRAKLDEARRMVADDRLSLASLADLEARTRPRVAELDRAARPRHVPPAVVDTVGPDAAARWAALDTSARRAVIGTLARVRVLPAPRRDGYTPFDPQTVEIKPQVSGL